MVLNEGKKTSMGLLCIEEKNIVVLYTNPLFQLKHFTETKTDKPYLQPNIKYIHQNSKIGVIIFNMNCNYVRKSF